MSEVNTNFTEGYSYGSSTVATLLGMSPSDSRRFFFRQHGNSEEAKSVGMLFNFDYKFS